jgi:hypothetical protein
MFVTSRRARIIEFDNSQVLPSDDRIPVSASSTLSL